MRTMRAKAALQLSVLLPCLQATGAWADSPSPTLVGAKLHLQSGVVTGYLFKSNNDPSPEDDSGKAFVAQKLKAESVEFSQDLVRFNLFGQTVDASTSGTINISVPRKDIRRIELMDLPLNGEKIGGPDIRKPVPTRLLHLLTQGSRQVHCSKKVDHEDLYYTDEVFFVSFNSSVSIEDLEPICHSAGLSAGSQMADETALLRKPDVFKVTVVYTFD